MDTACNRPPANKILSNGWGISGRNTHRGVALSGSPERCLWRSVMEDEQGKRFVLEEIDRRAVERKTEIAMVLARLAHQGLMGIHPYCRTRFGDFIFQDNGRYWLLRPYINGEPPDRPAYVSDAWRGIALADFLQNFRTASWDMPHSSRRRPFSIKRFILDLMGRIATHRPRLLPEVAPVVRYLETDFMLRHGRLPVAFCHGDYHPLNVIWMGKGIASVIDWEFCGYKPEIFDLALLLGCVGMEDPQGLTSSLVRGLLAETKPVFAMSSLDSLVDFVMAIRFAWLSEWLRGGDEEMVALECDYLELLLRERDALKEIWRSMIHGKPMLPGQCQPQ